MARDRLCDEIVKTLALFRKENHHPSAFRAPKEIREIEDAFEKAQRQWKKLHEKNESAKKSYYNACRAERSAAVLLANAQQDTSVSVDGTQKIRDRCDKAHDEVQRTKQNYEKYLAEIETYKTPYMENMTFVFAKCQQMELKRLKFFQEMIQGTEHVLLDLIRNNKFNQLHDQINLHLRATDDAVLNQDLKTWSQVYGVDAQMHWPGFEEYRPEMREISARKSSTKDNSGGVVLTRQIIKDEDPLPQRTTVEKFRQMDKIETGSHRSLPGSSQNSDSGKQGSSSDSDTNTFDSQKSGQKNRINKFQKATNNNYPQENRWDSLKSAQHHQPLNQSNSLVSSGASTLPPQSQTPDSEKFSEFDDYQKQLGTVLYDYSPIENDEIGLKKGETIEVLSEPDSLGWCTGRKNGLTGLFPASYVQV
ncbi:unnamed protein product, partial [Mesorhabditis spiculigera]